MSGEKRNRILVVDNEPSIRKAIQMSLQARNYTVDVAADGSEGTHMNRRHPYDLVILDLVLPSANGLEILRALRKDAPDILAVIITINDSLTSSIEAIELEVAAYIEKPLRMQSILEAVSKGFHNKAKKGLLIRKQVKSLSKKLREDIPFDQTSSHNTHQVNSPNTTIFGNAELAMMATDSPELLHQYLARIIKSSEKINSINRAFLRSGKNLHGSIEHFDPNIILHQCLQDFEAITSLMGIAVKVPTAYHKVTVSGNRFEFELILNNLLANAIDALEEYDEKTLRIEVEVPDFHHHMLIHIQDNGRGIPEEKMDTIFQPKFTTKPNGNGIGLHITRELLLRMEGDIQVESVVGNGAKFSLKLPILN